MPARARNPGRAPALIKPALACDWDKPDDGRTLAYPAQSFRAVSTITGKPVLAREVSALGNPEPNQVQVKARTKRVRQNYVFVQGRRVKLRGYRAWGRD